jgi:hypothetical protein
MANDVYEEVIQDQLQCQSVDCTDMTLCDLPEICQDRIQPEPNSGCWLWSGRLIKGYGILLHDDRMHQAHRLVYELVKGPIPEGLQLHHLCFTPACVNPLHLEPVTRSVNSRQRNFKRTHCRRGHPFSPTGVPMISPLMRGTPRQICKVCLSERNTQYLRELTFKRTGREVIPWTERMQKRTHCRKGHALQGDNLYVTKAGYRYCRLCALEYSHKQNAKRQAANVPPNLLAAHAKRVALGESNRARLAAIGGGGLNGQ